MTVRRILREEGLRPFRLMRAQELRPGDAEVRAEFCRWMKEKLRRRPNLLRNVLFTDESSFSSVSIHNAQNVRIWALFNPRAVIQRRAQGRFTLNVWAGILGDSIIGPYFLPRLTSAAYLNHLRNVLLPDLRRLVPRRRRRRLYFMHDGAAPHYSREVRNFLDQMFGTRWIGRPPAPHHWPPRSPDLNPMDFYLWGAVKALVYRTGQPFRTPAHLRQCIVEAFDRIRRDRGVLRRVRQNLHARLTACERNRGRHIEVGEQAQLLRAIGNDGSVLWLPE